MQRSSTDSRLPSTTDCVGLNEPATRQYVGDAGAIGTTFSTDQAQEGSYLVETPKKIAPWSHAPSTKLPSTTSYKSPTKSSRRKSLQSKNSPTSTITSLDRYVSEEVVTAMFPSVWARQPPKIKTVGEKTSQGKSPNRNKAYPQPVSLVKPKRKGRRNSTSLKALALPLHDESPCLFDGSHQTVKSSHDKHSPQICEVLEKVAPLPSLNPSHDIVCSKHKGRRHGGNRSSSSHTVYNKSVEQEFRELYMSKRRASTPSLFSLRTANVRDRLASGTSTPTSSDASKRETRRSEKRDKSSSGKTNQYPRRPNRASVAGDRPQIPTSRGLPPLQFDQSSQRAVENSITPIMSNQRPKVSPSSLLPSFVLDDDDEDGVLSYDESGSTPPTNHIRVQHYWENCGGR
eukprot:scaffold523_cov166-Amphora_coffeaeformis.AAC.2